MPGQELGIDGGDFGLQIGGGLVAGTERESEFAATRVKLPATWAVMGKFITANLERRAVAHDVGVTNTSGADRRIIRGQSCFGKLNRPVRLGLRGRVGFAQLGAKE
jgi:hypothetical protein